LSLLVEARARERHAEPAAVLRDAVSAFCALPPEVRHVHLHEAQWGLWSATKWEPHWPDADTLRLAGLACHGLFNREQIVVAAVAWFLVAI
jgi:hypothetical protein